MISLNFTKKLNAPKGEMKLHIQCEIEKGELVTLYGESGAGKTSTLRIIAGLLRPEKGLIEVNGVTWYNSIRKKNISPQKRKVGFVFQDYALFPNKTVIKNLEYALRTSESNQVVHDIMNVMELGELANRYPDTLSGGQKQRVALARALVQQPEILLLDEPLAALDMKIRLKLQDYLLQVHRRFKLTTILISHDIGEIHKISDRVLVLDHGQIRKEGTPSEIFAGQSVSGKFRFTGEVLSIEQEEVVFIVTVLIQNTVIKVIAQRSEIQNLNVGDQVMVVSKAFNPLIQKIE